MAQICFDSTAFYTVLIVSSAIIIYALTHNTKKCYKPKKIYKTLIRTTNHDIDYEESSRNFELQRFVHPMMPPMRRGPFNLSRGGLNRSRYGSSAVFNQMGYLLNSENKDQAMPLMGRQLHSQQYEYYTFHHNNPDIKIPIKINGDKEIIDNENVPLPDYPNTFKAKIYDLDTPRYVPY